MTPVQVKIFDTTNAFLKHVGWCGRQWEKLDPGPLMINKGKLEQLYQLTIRIVPAIFLLLATTFSTALGLVGCCFPEPKISITYLIDLPHDLKQEMHQLGFDAENNSVAINEEMIKRFPYPEAGDAIGVGLVGAQHAPNREVYIQIKDRSAFWPINRLTRAFEGVKYYHPMSGIHLLYWILGKAQISSASTERAMKRMLEPIRAIELRIPKALDQAKLTVHYRHCHWTSCDS